MRYGLLLFSLLLIACENINSGWEVDGGGFLKYKLNGQDSYQLEYGPDDVALPATGRHFISAVTKKEASGSSVSFLVREPKLGKNPLVAEYTYFIYNSGPKAALIGDSNFVTFDQKDDSTWTADLNLYFIECRSGVCIDSMPPVHFTGRFRYWLNPDQQKALTF